MAKEPYHEIRNSGIHGRGLFARRFIPKDTLILEYLGEKVSKEESELRSEALLEKSKHDGSARVYTFILNDEWDIDGDFDYNDARLVNHSCDPNVEAHVYDGKEIWIVALRDIQPGEELLYNYGFDLDSWEEHPCGCGSPRCPGYIVDEDLWPKLKRRIAAKKAREARQAQRKAPAARSGSATAKRSKAA